MYSVIVQLPLLSRSNEKVLCIRFLAAGTDGIQISDVRRTNKFRAPLQAWGADLGARISVPRFCCLCSAPIWRIGPLNLHSEYLSVVNPLCKFAKGNRHELQHGGGNQTNISSPGALQQIVQDPQQGVLLCTYSLPDHARPSPILPSMWLASLGRHGCKRFLDAGRTAGESAESDVGSVVSKGRKDIRRPYGF